MKRPLDQAFVLLETVAPTCPSPGQFPGLPSRTGRLLTQRTKDKSKLYALHAPNGECISKGKARTLCEFGVKISIATTLKECLVVGARSC